MVSFGGNREPGTAVGPEISHTKWPDIYCFGACDLNVQWWGMRGYCIIKSCKKSDALWLSLSQRKSTYSCTMGL